MRQQDFDAKMRRFHAAAGPGHRPPLPARELAPRLLASSQLLKISTIDSLFLEWVSKFPFEARPEAGADRSAPVPTTLLDPLTTRQLEKQAWRATGQLLTRAMKRGEDWPELLLSSLPDGGILALQRHLEALDSQDTYLWYAEKLAAEGRDIVAAAASDLMTSAELMAAIAGPLRAIAAVLSDAARQDSCLRAIAEQDYAAFLATGLLTLEFAVSGRYIRGAKKDALSREIAEVEAAVRHFIDQQRGARLARIGACHYQLYRLYRGLRDELKAQAGSLEFRDLVKGGFQLLHGEGSAGVRFLLARTVQHVLLDEFQDTSRLQWSVFHALLAPMLAGDGLESDSALTPTVFIVGDAKAIDLRLSRSRSSRHGRGPDQTRGPRARSTSESQLPYRSGHPRFRQRRL